MELPGRYSLTFIGEMLALLQPEKLLALFQTCAPVLKTRMLG